MKKYLIISASQHNNEKNYSFYSFEDDDACISFSKRVFGERLIDIYFINENQTTNDAIRKGQKVHISRVVRL